MGFLGNNKDIEELKKRVSLLELDRDALKKHLENHHIHTSDKIIFENDNLSEI